jgi:hypothetical protein
MRAPLLSTAPIPAPISPPHVQNHLPIEAPPSVSIEHRRVAISTPLCDAMDENPDDLLSLSLGYHDDLLSLRSGCAAPWS